MSAIKVNPDLVLSGYGLAIDLRSAILSDMPPVHCVVNLPKHVFEQNLVRLVKILAEGDKADEIELNFKAVEYYCPSAIVSIVAKIKFWEDMGKTWSLSNFSENPASTYFQRIDFCKVLGIDLKENFSRHPAHNKFVPVESIPQADMDVAPLATKLSLCIDPDQGETFQLLQFATSESILNARQHSGGKGFVAAQYYPRRELACIGVADCGIGIRESFRANGSPHYRESYTDADFLRLAIKPEVSSTTHLRTEYGRSPNRGVGLSMMKALVNQTLGYMCLISGSGWLRKDGHREPETGHFPDGIRFHGTICALAFTRNQIDDWFGMLDEARNSLGLQSNRNLDNIFS